MAGAVGLDGLEEAGVADQLALAVVQRGHPREFVLQRMGLLAAFLDEAREFLARLPDDVQVVEEEEVSQVVVVGLGWR